MNEHLHKVANDLQQAYDSYRGRVQRLQEDATAFDEASNAYEEAKPGWENPVRTAIPLAGAGIGALTGGRWGKRHGVPVEGAILGLGGGLLGGMVGQAGVSAGLDIANPERRMLRTERDNVWNRAALSGQDVMSAQQMLEMQGRQNPSALYPLLQPGDEYDRALEGSIHSALVREQQMNDERAQLEHESMRAQIDKDRSKALKNNMHVYNSN